MGEFYDTLDEYGLRQLDYEMRHEIKDRYRVQFTNFLKVLVNRCAVDEETADKDVLFESLLPIAIKVYNSEEFQEGRELLEEYCAARTNERRGHHLLSKCFNKVFELMRKEEMPGLREVSRMGHQMIFHPNNPVMLTHTYSSGYKTHFSPDLCVATQGRVYEKMYGKADSPAKLEWSDVICAAEARLLGEKGFPAPPKEYTEADAKDVKEYYTLQDKHIYRRDKCASECLLVTSSEPGDAFKNDLDWSHQDDDNGSVRYDYSDSEDTESDAGTSSQSREWYVTKQPNARSSSEIISQIDVSPNSQVTLYAREILCRGIYSLHSINLLIVDDLVWLWWYDRSNTIQTTGLNFVQHMPYLMMLLAAFQRFTYENWGVLAELAPREMFIGYAAEPNLREILWQRWFGKPYPFSNNDEEEGEEDVDEEQEDNEEVDEEVKDSEEVNEDETDNEKMDVDDSATEIKGKEKANTLDVDESATDIKGKGKAKAD